MRIDAAVRHDGKTKRFVAKDDSAMLLSRDGTITKLTVVEPAEGRKLPQVEDEDGNAVALRRTSRPCSCVGGIWKTRLSELEAQL